MVVEVVDRLIQPPYNWYDKTVCQTFLHKINALIQMERYEEVGDTISRDADGLGCSDVVVYLNMIGLEYYRLENYKAAAK